MNDAAAPLAVEEEPREEGEEFEDLSAMLEHLGLAEYKGTFEEEKIDVESFVRIQKASLARLPVQSVPKSQNNNVMRRPRG